LTFLSSHLLPFSIPINAFNIIEETLNQTTVHQSFHAVNAAGDFYYAYCFLSILRTSSNREKVNHNFVQDQSEYSGSESIPSAF
jgi:hypothetical protein